MKSIWKSTVVLSGALAAVIASGAAASAETGYGTQAWGNCTNSVVMGREGGQVSAYAITKCKTAHEYINPAVGLAGHSGKYGLVDKTVVCHWASYCETPKVYLTEITGVDYSASNFGSVGGDPFNWPPSAVAHASLIGGDRTVRAGSEAGSGRVRWADFDG
ncbi:hypothetical protein, partial [Kitasatospora sp. NPDC047058]|uniref:hypothetical protein n=1 Tax=Kitasatospora sp. NPDC047058 TaxID=3155620 RepID=UPI0033E7BAD5